MIVVAPAAVDPGHIPVRVVGMVTEDAAGALRQWLPGRLFAVHPELFEPRWVR